MFSLRRRVRGQTARLQLAILGIVSVAGLLAISGSHYFTLGWLQPVRYALAQSDTATPTAVPQPHGTPAPTAGLAAPPLTLHSSASAARAAAGEQLSFTTTIAVSSAEPRAVELRASIDGQIDLVSVSGGSCSALSCKLSVQASQSATVVTTVRVRPNASPGQLVYQALAQDDLSNTAASDQVVVTLAAAPADPTRPPEPTPGSQPNQGRPASGGSAPARPASSASRPAPLAPTAAPASAADPVAQNTAAPVALALPAVPAAAMRRSAGEAPVIIPSDSAAPVDSWLELASGVPATAQAIEPPAVALAAPQPQAPLRAQAAPAPAMEEQRPLVQLPNTAAAPPSAVLAGLLLGLALTVHGLRRVRRAAAQLERQGAALGHLATLADVRAQRRAEIGDLPAKTCEQ